MLDDALGGEDEKGPTEPDPEADLPNYEEELAPSVDIPEAPSPRSTVDGDVPKGLQRKFWALVLAFNAALLAGSLGAMYLWFRGDWYLGSRLLLAGAVCFVYGVFRLRTWDLPRGDGGGSAGEDDEPTGDEPTGDEPTGDATDDTGPRPASPDDND